MSRNKEIDIAKGIGICLVVAGHCFAPGSRLIYEFHMALFFMLAGYCFSDKHTEDIQSIFRLIGKRIKSLYIPFVLINEALLLSHNWLMKYNVYTDNAEFLQTYTGKNYGISPAYFDWQIKIYFKKILLFQAEQQLAGATWFLRVLFGVTVLFAFNNFLFRKITKNSKKNIFFLHFAVSCIFLGIASWCNWKKINLLLDFDTVCTAYWLFFFGYCFKTYNIKMFSTQFYEKRKILMIISPAIGLGACDILCVVNGWSSSVNQFTNPFVFIASSVCGIFLTLAEAKLLSKNRIGKILNFIGQKTMGIMIFQFISFKAVIALQMVIYKEPSYMLASFPVLYSKKGWWIVYTIVGIGIPMIGYKICSMLKSGAYNFKKKFRLPAHCVGKKC